MSAADPMDAAPPDDLAEAFRLHPQVTSDPELIELHAALVQRLRREAMGLPMNTTQQLLLERIAHNYIVMKDKERNNGFATPAQQKDYNTFWLSMTQEFNKLLMANDDKLREAMLLEVQKIITTALNLIPDTKTRQDVRRHLQEQFAAIEV